jgi:deoxyribodipyrimidine photo-lyase
MNSFVSSDALLSYGQKRNTPFGLTTSRLGADLRFGLISIRELVDLCQQAAQHAAPAGRASVETYIKELAWREFYLALLWHHPEVFETEFNPDWRDIPWPGSEEQFEIWTVGRTGFPIVDAGIRELLATGFMHNRVRMVTASFLTKHLLIDWRLGEAYFAQKLLDFDLASNNGGWQWAAGCGTDAAPYFRIFSPEAQAQKFDKQALYIKKWVPEYGTSAYAKPVVEHAFARSRCLDTYKKALQGG